MASALSTVPLDRRRRSAWVASGFAVVLLAVGVLPWTMQTDSVIRFLTAFVLLAAVLTGLVAVGLLRSMKVAPPRASSGGCGGGCQCGQQQPGC
ncbi:hypothetical protein ACXR2U_04760 [Jatrophihabitans sp. YIM 134969]